MSWRNIFIKTSDLEKELSAEITSIPQANHVANYLSKREAEAGWKLLWNGKDMKGWKSLDPKNDLTKGWTPTNGVLVIKPNVKPIPCHFERNAVQSKNLKTGCLYVKQHQKHMVKLHKNNHYLLLGKRENEPPL